MQLVLTFPLAALPVGNATLHCELQSAELAASSLAPGRATARAWRAQAEEVPRGAVAVDFVSRGLEVDGLPFFPTSFYTHWPVTAADAAERALGFNAMAPYGAPAPADAATLTWLDDCAAAGIKAHYHLTSLTTADPLDIATITAAVEAVRGHPAVLAYYIADEPDGPGNQTERDALRNRLVQAHDVIHALDPYHPVSLVLNCLHSAPDYVDAADVLMADPYCVGLHDPVGCDYCTQGVLDVETRVRTVLAETAATRPLWLVSQAFGGGEHWRRAPSPGEQRAMTYLGLVSGATGLQPFAREGLWPRFAMWAALRQAAREVATLTPFLLSKQAAPAAALSGDAAQLRARAWRWTGGDGATRVLLLVVNAAPTPAAFTAELSGTALASNAEATVLFEDLRPVTFTDGRANDVVGGFSTHAYVLVEEGGATLRAGQPAVQPEFRAGLRHPCPRLRLPVPRTRAPLSSSTPG